MDHNRLKDMVFALYDGQLDDASRGQAQAHLEVCPECRQAYDQWSGTAKVFLKPQKVQTSEFFVQTVMNRVHDLERAQAPARVGWPFSLRWLVPALSAVFLFVLFVPLPSSLGTASLTVDNLLFQGSAERSSWIFSTGALNADQTLQLVMEDQA